eukprot:4542924-Amphidinium_carterae.1
MTQSLAVSWPLRDHLELIRWGGSMGPGLVIIQFNHSQNRVRSFQSFAKGLAGLVLQDGLRHHV